MHDTTTKKNLRHFRFSKGCSKFKSSGICLLILTDDLWGAHCLHVRAKLPKRGGLPALLDPQKVKRVRCSETSANIYQPKRLNTPEYLTLRACKRLKQQLSRAVNNKMSVSPEKRLVQSGSCRRSPFVTFRSRTVGERAYERVHLEGNSKETGLADICINAVSTSKRWRVCPRLPFQTLGIVIAVSVPACFNAPFCADRRMKTVLSARSPSVGTFLYAAVSTSKRWRGCPRLPFQTLGIVIAVSVAACFNAPFCADRRMKTVLRVRGRPQLELSCMQLCQLLEGGEAAHVYPSRHWV